MAKLPRSESNKSEAGTKRKPHHTIQWLEVTGGGFLKGVRFEFADGLNCVIGGRGTGKTTVLELLRYVLGLVSDEKATPARSRAIRALLQSNLGGGCIRVGVRTKHGMGYRADRSWNEEPQVYDQQGEPTAVSFDRELIFTADVYSQNEIEEIATNPNLQLALIDRFIEEPVRRIDADMRKLLRDLDENAGELQRLDRSTRDLLDVALDAPVLEEKLKELQETGGPDATLVNTAHDQRALREKERKTLEALRDDARRARTELDSAVTTAVRRMESRMDRDVAEGANAAVFTAVARSVRELTTAMQRTAATVAQQADSFDGLVAAQEKALAERHAKQDAEYRSLIAKSQEQTGRAAERTQLQQRYAEVMAAKKDLDLCRTERKSREAHRQELTAKLSTLRDDRFHLRKAVADRLSEALRPSIRVTLTQAANREAYRTLLTEALKGHGMRHGPVVDRIAQAVSPEELSVLVRRNDASRLIDSTGLDEDRAKRVVNALEGAAVLYDLETVELEDRPRIELLDGRDYKESSDLSTGQRCTTILPILLLESERPLLIDQPEDNLDNAFIYETVVRSLKGAKGRRQLIFVTHNPNIPVLGEAERVFVLTSDGKQGKLAKVGSVDELKGEIELLLEGGREAFLLRKQRYGH